MKASVTTTIRPASACGVSEISIASDPYACSIYSNTKLSLTIDEARDLAATLTAAIAAHAVAANLLPARAAVESVAGDAVADTSLPENAAVVS